jgi:hypothetical protein
MTTAYYILQSKNQTKTKMSEKRKETYRIYGEMRQYNNSFIHGFEVNNCAVLIATPLSNSILSKR